MPSITFAEPAAGEIENTVQHTQILSRLASLLPQVARATQMVHMHIDFFIQHLHDMQSHIQKFDQSHLMTAQHQIQNIAQQLQWCNIQPTESLIKIIAKNIQDLLQEYHAPNIYIQQLENIKKILLAIYEYLEEVYHTQHVYPERLYYYFTLLNALPAWYELCQSRGNQAHHLLKNSLIEDTPQVKHYSSKALYAQYEPNSLKNAQRIFSSWVSMIQKNHDKKYLQEKTQELEKAFQHLSCEKMYQVCQYCILSRENNILQSTMLLLFMEYMLEKTWRIHTLDLCTLNDFAQLLIDFYQNGANIDVLNHLHQQVYQYSLLRHLRDILVENVIQIYSLQQQNSIELAYLALEKMERVLVFLGFTQYQPHIIHLQKNLRVPHQNLTYKDSSAENANIYQSYKNFQQYLLTSSCYIFDESNPIVNVKKDIEMIAYNADKYSTHADQHNNTNIHKDTNSDHDILLNKILADALHHLAEIQDQNIYTEKRRIKTILQDLRRSIKILSPDYELMLYGHIQSFQHLTQNNHVNNITDIKKWKNQCINDLMHIKNHIQLDNNTSSESPLHTESIKKASLEKRLSDAFYKDAQNVLKTIEDRLINMQNKLLDIKKLYQPLHTLVGSSKTAGFIDIHQLWQPLYFYIDKYQSMPDDALIESSLPALLPMLIEHSKQLLIVSQDVGSSNSDNIFLQTQDVLQKALGHILLNPPELRISVKIEEGANAEIKIEQEKNTNASLITSDDAKELPISPIEFEILDAFYEEAQGIYHHIEPYIDDIYKNHDKKQEVLRGLHTLKGSSRTANLESIGQMYHDLEDMIAQNNSTEYIKEKIYSSKQALDTQYHQKNIGQNAQALQNATEDIQQDWMVKIPIQRIDHFINIMTHSQNKIYALLHHIKNLNQNMRMQESVYQRMMQLFNNDDKNNFSQKTMPESQKKISRPYNMDVLEFDDFSESQHQINEFHQLLNNWHDVYKNVQTTLDYMSNETQNLQDDLMNQQRSWHELSLIHIKLMENRLSTIAERCALEQNKKIRFTFVCGEHIQITKSMMDQLIFISEHLIRNSIIHGIESSLDRENKPSHGHVSLDIQQQGEQLFVQFIDDGIGIDVHKIRKKAIDKNWLTEDEDISIEQMLDFITQSDFSTADHLSLSAGRGVGLDSVIAQIKQLGGEIKFNAEYQIGMRIDISLPLISFMSEMLICQSGEYIFGFPLNHIERIEAYENHAFENANIAEKSAQTEFYKMSDIMQTEEKDACKHILHLNHPKRSCAFILDVIQYQKMFIRNTPLIHHPKGLIGMSTSAYQKMIPVYNPIILLDAYQQNKKDSTHYKSQSAISRLREFYHIMVVDDSVTIRLSAQKMFAEQYKLSFAIDGIDAIEQIEYIKMNHLPKIDIFLLDIEMPRMDGFALLHHLREKIEYMQTPIIMVSSRQAEKYQQKAYELGANDYLAKPYQAQELSMRIIRELAKYKQNKMIH